MIKITIKKINKNPNLYNKDFFIFKTRKFFYKLIVILNLF